MDYLFNTKIKNITQTEGDRFVVTLDDVQKSEQMALMDDLGRISADRYYSISKRLFDDFYDAEISFNNNVLIDKNGRVICRDYYEVHSFNDGVAVLEKERNSRAVFLTSEGKILGQEFLDVIGFANGRGVVQLHNGKFCLVDKNMEIISPTFDYIYPFYNKDYTTAVISQKTVILDSDLKVVSNGYFDENGKKHSYENVMLIDENNIIWHRTNNREDKTPFCYISVDGKKLGASHTMLHGYSEGISRVQDLEGTSYVDLEGNYITDKHFINSTNFSGGFAVVGAFDDDGEFIFAYLKKDGTLLHLKAPYFANHPEKSSYWVESANDFTDGLGSIIIKGNDRKIINTNGEVLKGSYSWLGLFSNGFAPYQKKNGKVTFINTKLNSFEKEFDSATHFMGDFAVVKYNGKYDAVKSNETMLSEISELASKIEADPISVSMLTDDALFDQKLVSTLISYAKFIALNKQDQNTIQMISKIELELLKRGKFISKEKQKQPNE